MHIWHGACHSMHVVLRKRDAMFCSFFVLLMGLLGFDLTRGVTTSGTLSPVSSVGCGCQAIQEQGATKPVTKSQYVFGNP